MRKIPVKAESLMIEETTVMVMIIGIPQLKQLQTGGNYYDRRKEAEHFEADYYTFEQP